MAGHTADHVGTAISAAVVAGEPEVFYYDASSASLRWARLTGAGWQFETLDGPGSTLYQHTWHHVGSALSAVVVGGAPQVYYYDSTAGALHRAWRNGSRWFFLTIDGPTSRNPGHTGYRVGSAISATLLGGQPQVYYDDDGAASLRYARLTGAGWQFETLDGPSSTLPGRTGDHVGSAVSVTQMNGNAQVYYYDATRRSLRHAWMERVGVAVRDAGRGRFRDRRARRRPGRVGRQRDRDGERPAGLLHRRDRPFAAARLVDVDRLAVRDPGRPRLERSRAGPATRSARPSRSPITRVA